MSFQILLSTMNKTNEEVMEMLKKNNISSSTLVINQNKKDDSFKNENVIVLSYNERGLSKSRNRALENTNADICLIADDDIKYVDDIENIIVNSFIQNPDYDIIAFFVESNERKECRKKKKINFLKSLSIMSVQIAYRPSSIKKNNVKFDERFGTGSGLYTSGEENIFLADCLKKGLKILYIPQKIASLQEGESSWFTGFDEKFFVSKGALFYRLSPALSVLLIISFAILKYPMYKKTLKMKQAIKCMMSGRKQLKGN